MARMTCTRSTLNGRALFSALRDAEIDALLPWIQVRSYPTRAPVLRTGDAPAGLYLILSGRVKIVLEDGHGREVIVEVLGPDQFFGEASLYDERPGLQAAVAQQPSDILYIPRKPALDCIQHNANAALQVSRVLAQRLEAAHLKIGSLGLDDVYARVVDLLLSAGYEEGGTWRVDMGSELIAAMVGASREMVSRVVKEFVDRGIVRRQRRRLYVLDRKMLRECVLQRRRAAQARREGTTTARPASHRSSRSVSTHS